MKEIDETLREIFRAADKHPNSKVSKLIRTVDQEPTQKNVVLLLIELAEHAEYATEFGISLKYYLELFERLGIGRDMVLNEAGLLLVNSSKIYAKRVDYVQDLVERQILTLSNAEHEITEAKKNEASTSETTEKPKRGRKRHVEAPSDPYEVELVPKKIRKLTNEKRFSANRPQVKAKTVRPRRQNETEQYVHPAVWVHANIVDLENEEDVDSKRNYKLFTYHVEHRYNTLVQDINFRLHFKVKDYIDEEVERMEEDGNSSDVGVHVWPPLSEEYVRKYLHLENQVLEEELMPARKRQRLEQHKSGEKTAHLNVTSGEEEAESNTVAAIGAATTTSNEVQNVAAEKASLAEPTLAEPMLVETTPAETTLAEKTSAETTLTDTSTHNDTFLNNSSSNATDNTAISNDSALGGSLLDTTNNTTTNTDSTPDQSLLDATNTTLDQVQNSTNDSALGSSLLDPTQNETQSNNMNESAVSTDKTVEKTGVSDDSIKSNNDTSTTSDKTADGIALNDNSIAENKEASVSPEKTLNQTEQNIVEKDDKDKETENKSKKGESDVNLGEIRVILPHLDDEGVFFCDLDEHDQRMLLPTVMATDVLPSVPNKRNIRFRVNDDLKVLLDIPDDEAETYELRKGLKLMHESPPLQLNILKIHEKFFKRRTLFKLGVDMDLYKQARMMKRSRAEAPPVRQPRTMQLFPLNSTDMEGVRMTPMLSTDGDECDFHGFSDDDETQDFAGFTEEEQSRLLLDNSHRLSRDSGVGVDIPITPTTSDFNHIAEEYERLSKARRSKPLENIAEAAVESELAAAQSEVANMPEGAVSNNEKAAAENAVSNNEIAAADSADNAKGDENTVANTTSSKEQGIANEASAAVVEQAKESNETPEDAALAHNTEANASLLVSSNSENLTDTAVIPERDTAVVEDSPNDDKADDLSDSLPEAPRNKQFDEAELAMFSTSKTKIQKWHEHLQPILAKSRDRHHFDVFEIGTEIIDSLQPPSNAGSSTGMPQNTSFQDVMQGKDASYVSRYFLSTLLLANQNNIEIKVNNQSAGQPSAWHDIEFALISTKRHTVAIEDNIGLINKKSSPLKSNTAATCKATTKPPKPIGSNQVCSITTPSAAKRLARDDNTLLNVNLSVVKPLKPIEKSPQNNDDYDSGIFSNEDWTL